MAEYIEFTERRKHKRYPVEEGTVSVVVYPSPVIIGRLIDISEGGISFTYVPDREKINASCNIDIFSGNEGYYLRRILFKTIYDDYMDNEFPFSSINLKRCGGEIERFTDDQKSRMTSLIIKNTIGKIENGSR